MRAQREAALHYKNRDSKLTTAALARVVGRKTTNDLFDATRSAVISPCGKYRYELWRRVGVGETFVVFVLLNPSTADADLDDPTIRACMEFARRWGFAWMCVVNLFALRSTKPENLYASVDPIGPENDRYIQHAVLHADCVVAAWGKHGRHRDRNTEVVRLVGNRPLHYLALNLDGSPKHPLYISREGVRPTRWSTTV